MPNLAKCYYKVVKNVHVHTESLPIISIEYIRNHSCHFRAIADVPNNGKFVGMLVLLILANFWGCQIWKEKSDNA